MRLCLLLTVFAVLVIAGCSAQGDEPTASQKKLVPEAANGKPVTAQGDRFTRQSDRN